jgi:hypothetical protein
MAVVFVALSAEERTSLRRRLDLMPLVMTRGGRTWMQ